MPLLLLCLLLLVSCAKPPRDHVVLLDAPGSESGAGVGTLSVTTRQGTQTLATSYATAAVQPDGRVQVGTTTPAQVQQRYGAVLATIPEPGRVFPLYFTTGGTQLTPESQAEIPALLAEVARRGAVEVEITGHTDTRGDALKNDALSLARAEAVRALLALPPGAFVRVVGRGERALLVPTADDVDAPANRRVEVLVR